VLKWQRVATAWWWRRQADHARTCLTDVNARHLTTEREEARKEIASGLWNLGNVGNEGLV
jgi:hypothetical protein